MNDRIVIIIVGAKDSANIGAVARSMKNFGVSNLRLIKGVRHNSRRAQWLARSASDILCSATKFRRLEDAIFDTTYVVGFTSRFGKGRRLIPWTILAKKVYRRLLAGARVALVFGREDNGLNSHEINLCHELAVIETNITYPSMNVSHAVTASLYMLVSKLTKQSLLTGKEYEVTQDVIEDLLSMARRRLDVLHYKDDQLREKIMNRWRKIFGRAGLSRADATMIKALLNTKGTVPHL